ncbi:MAG: asparagine synthase (glutamine-hydrolyzing) [Bacteroidetes bacterium]|nr:MAG: asparagine synthase (glutamine-hydrolyzing) [Bacteroidota bacterium]
MCGIAGIIDLNGSRPLEQEVTTMIKTLKHRGPDDDGYYIHENVALGHVRLSIIDLSEAGKQPLFSHDKRYVLTYNGEIYNYLELKKELEDEFVFHSNTDSEVLLNAYIKWGEDFLHRLNGMFAFAIYDTVNKTVFCARDRFGVKPFYYSEIDNRLIFASEPAGILSVWNKKPNTNYQQVYDYLVFNRTDHDEDSFFEGIKKLPHGHTLKVQDNRTVISRWYGLASCNPTPFKDHNEYYDALCNSVKLRLRSDVPVGLTLSGGLDSSSIASILIKEFGKQDINTFSAVYGENEQGDESHFINLYKNELKNMHFVYPKSGELFDDLDSFVGAQQEPFGTTSIYASYKIMKDAKSVVKVMLNGQGADEHLAGYHYFFGNYYVELLRQLQWITLVKECLKYYSIYNSIYAHKTFLFFLLPSNLQTKARLIEKKFIDRDFMKNYAGSSNVPGKLYDAGNLNDSLLNHFEYKLEHLLKWDDRNTMRFGIEARNPFLDYRLIEGTIKTPSTFKISDGYTKRILRNALNGVIPEEIGTRKDKMGFETPDNEWFRQDNFKTLITDILHDGSFKSRKLVNVDKAQVLYKRHLDRKINISGEIWKWVNLELWMRKFID